MLVSGKGRRKFVRHLGKDSFGKFMRTCDEEGAANLLHFTTFFVLYGNVLYDILVQYIGDGTYVRVQRNFCRPADPIFSEEILLILLYFCAGTVDRAGNQYLQNWIAPVFRTSL